MRTFLFFLACILITNAATAQRSPVFIKNGIAINGYDAVAYFTAGKPVKGDKQFVHEWNNATWHFSSKANLDSFMVAPSKYAPQYGGYCAFGIADGHKAPTEPDAWSIVDGKLYFNYNKQVLGMWKQKQAVYIDSAEKNWPLLKDKE